MAEQFAARLGREAFALDEGVVGEGGAQGLAQPMPFCMAWPVVATVMV